ncbi:MULTISPECIES: hypothetical protein [Bradyrhizobium]|uniref:Uncharacterized protein n=1 Tax=Bradyrhizobium barranii subsp. barranii TaxID=2823807 RepID=A0A939M217_9BRAD|nr:MULTISPECIES: hypothetical protein [Bradyrhizobium]UEM14409.1 hypothetical protein J4G43_009245 [Bradyrhizobium barranii subsp. barranii]WLB88041.1 hypothetical protein QIH91_36080 [Bradyrhizobium japonicum USDA 135]GLR92797.1 hypothetical protein GCM10007858_04190 [Bradyrhizobium liaoningense]
MKAGDYVRCNFPFREIAGPGPSPHIVLCLAVGRIQDEDFAVVAYTTTRVSFEGERRPRQHLLANEQRAVALGQSKAFHADASRVARLPLTQEYFPDLHNGQIATFGHDPAFVDKVA